MLILEQQAKTEEVKNRINSQNKEGKCKSMLACFKKCKVGSCARTGETGLQQD